MRGAGTRIHRAYYRSHMRSFQSAQNMRGLCQSWKQSSDVAAGCRWRDGCRKRTSILLIQVATKISRTVITDRLEIAYMTDTIEYVHGYYDGYKWMDKYLNAIKNVVAWRIHEPYQPETETPAAGVEGQDAAYVFGRTS